MPVKRIMRTCPTCGSPFETFPYRPATFCSHPCFLARRGSLADRFWAKVTFSDEPLVCPQIWAGGKNVQGYGVIWSGQPENRLVLATHVALRLAGIPIADDEWALHSCPGGDNSACVTVAHLRIGDRKANVRDMWERGRANIQQPSWLPRRGENGTAAKLTDAKVLEMRRIYATTDTSFQALGDHFGVSLQSAYRAVCGLTYSHLPNPVTARPQGRPRSR